MRVSDVADAFPNLPLHPDVWQYCLFRFFGSAGSDALQCYVHLKELGLLLDAAHPLQDLRVEKAFRLCKTRSTSSVGTQLVVRGTYSGRSRVRLPAGSVWWNWSSSIGLVSARL